MTDETELEKCKYKSPNGLSCQRGKLSIDNDFCVFHQGCNRKSDEELSPNLLFESAFDVLLEQQDGKWDGFVFPSNLKLPNKIKFPVYAQCACFTILDLSGTTFEDAVDFSDAIFLGNAIFRRVTFKSETKFNRCQFEAGFELQYTHFDTSASFHQAEFSKQAVFRVRFGGSCNLNQTTFREGVRFSGWTVNYGSMSATLPFPSISAIVTCSLSQPANLTIFQSIKRKFKQTQKKVSDLFQRTIEKVSDLVQQVIEKLNDSYHQTVRMFSTQNPGLTIYRVFESEGRLQDVVFIKPEQVLFSEVDLSRVYFRGTNLRGVRFLGVNWWQPKLGRNGLYDELFIRLSKDGFFRFQNLPALEQTCRNIRVSLEESRDFNVASDFYIAEMEALRGQFLFMKRHFFSVAALYKYVSYYGTSVSRGLLVLALLFVLHLKLTLLYSPLENITEEALRTVKIFSLQMISHEYQSTLTNGQRWIDAIFRVITPIQIAMLVLAFRTRIKRS